MLKIFENKNVAIKVETIVDNKQVVYFKGKDVAKALGYADAKKSFRIT